MSSEPVSFGEVLRHLRSQATLSQEELAERTGLSVRGISDLERGARRAPHLHTVRLLADALAASEIDRALLLSSARPPPCAPTALGESHHWMRAPHPLTRLIGREGQLATVQALLGREDVRLVTLTGAGGIGKTRLAVAVAMATAARICRWRRLCRSRTTARSRCRPRHHCHHARHPRNRTEAAIKRAGRHALLATPLAPAGQF